MGHHVAQQLHELGVYVVGTGQQAELQADLKGIVDVYVGCDLTDPDEVTKLELIDVDAIINLAGFAKPSEARGKGELCNKVNVGVHTVLYDECLRQGVSPRIIAVSTGAVYDPNQELPITEESELVAKDKTNEYVVSKQLMEEAVREYKDKGLHCIIVRPFNHSGPGQLSGFLLPDLGEQIEIAISQNKPLLIGNLNTKRDYTDVRDVAKAYVELATCDKSKLQHEIYNICSGKSVSGKEILQSLASAFGASDIKTEIDQTRLRTNDIMDIYGSRQRLTTDTGWEPEIAVDQMIKDYVNWRKSQ